MTAKQVKMVRETWRVFRGISAGTLGDLFYSRLFSDHAALRKMFPPDMQQQYQKLMDMLNTIIMRLDKPWELTEEITAMAKRHVQYGVRPAHYKLVGNALLWTLQKGLGEDWNDEVKTAWATCYQLLANLMIETSAIADK